MCFVFFGLEQEVKTYKKGAVEPDARQVETESKRKQPQKCSSLLLLSLDSSEFWVFFCLCLSLDRRWEWWQNC